MSRKRGMLEFPGEFAERSLLCPLKKLSASVPSDQLEFSFLVRWDRRLLEAQQINLDTSSHIMLKC